LIIEPGQQELTLRLKRWFSGDTHVHFPSTQGSHLEAAGEGLNVVNLLLSQWGHLFTNIEEFTGGPSVSRNGRTIVYASQENRQHLLGHLGLLGLKEPVMPWSSGGPNESEMGGTLEVTLSDWADHCHAQGGTVILPHLPNPNGEGAALIATGRVDAVELSWFRGLYNLHEYYRYLNGGYRLPLVGGTDKMSSEIPVGLYRTYVYIPPDQDFTFDTWRANLAAGRTFMSGGPIISLTVEGHAIGDTVRLSGNGGTVEVKPQGEPMAVDHEYPFGAFALLRHADLLAAILGRGEGSIEEGHRPIELTPLVESRPRGTPDALPDACFAPAFESSPDRRWRAILCWQILPSAAGDKDVEDAFNGPAVVGAWTTRARWWWQ
jgi:hypothetical protein